MASMTSRRPGPAASRISGERKPALAPAVAAQPVTTTITSLAMKFLISSTIASS